jgi:hypothetical protein
MRTTLTLDPDVVAALQKVVAKSGVSFKEAVNTALRTGLAATKRPAQAKRRFVQRTWNGGPMLLDWSAVKQLLLDDEVERFLETDRR